MGKVKKKKVYVHCSNVYTNDLMRSAIEMLKLEKTNNKDLAEFMLIELKRPAFGFHENNLELLDQRPAIIVFTQDDRYKKEILEHLKEKGIETRNKKLIRIPMDFLGMVDCIKHILKNNLE